MTLTGIELETRRRLLGLSQQDLGLCMAVIAPRDDDPRPVSQNTISKWEEGRVGLPLSGWVAMWNTALVHAVDAIDDGRDYMLDAVR